MKDKTVITYYVQKVFETTKVQMQATTSKIVVSYFQINFCADFFLVKYRFESLAKNTRALGHSHSS
jgi:hypothetical protein